METNTDIILKIVALGAQVAIPISLYWGSRLIALAQYKKTSLDAWSDFNKQVLAHPDNFQPVRDLLGPDFSGMSDQDIRKTCISFMLLNNLQATYFGNKHGILSRRHSDEICNDVLRHALADEFTYNLSQTRGKRS